MEREQFRAVNKIIERESKSASYKFALLRATIEIAEKYDHLATETPDQRIHLPTGLLVEKWLVYYYPLLSNLRSLRHATNGALAFEKNFAPIIEFYEKKDGGGFPSFFNDLTEGKYPGTIKEDVRKLSEKIRHTIVNQPMYYLGSSLNQEQSHNIIYHPENKKTPVKKNETVNHELLLRKFGSFSIPKWFYETLRYFGSFLSGQESLLMQWAKFTYSINRGSSKVEKSKILEQLLESPEKERNVKEIQKFLKNKKNIHCIWSKEKIDQKQLHIDHCIPFSVYYNNDLWNLLPTKEKTNSRKSDKIPSPELLEKRKDLLIDHWIELEEHSTLKPRFRDELDISLLGKGPTAHDDYEQAFQNLSTKCEFYIEEKGMTPFEG